jgi:hypothetical protein
MLMRKLIPYVLAAASLLTPACQTIAPPARVSLVSHVEGAGIWTDERPRIEARAPGAERVVFRLNGESQTDTQAPFELDTTTLPSGAVPFTVEAYFPGGEVATLDSGAYVKKPENACDLSTLIEPTSRAFLEGIIADRTDTAWHPSLPEGQVVLFALDSDTYEAFREHTIETLMRLDRRIVESIEKIYLASSIMHKGLPAGGVNQPGVNYISAVASPSGLEKFVHTLLSENATLQVQAYYDEDLIDDWDATNIQGYSELSYEEYLAQRGSANTTDLDVDLLRSHNFVNFYGSRNRPEDMSQFMAMIYRRPDRLLYFAHTVPHTGAKLAVFDQAFATKKSGIEYVECLAHERD